MKTTIINCDMCGGRIYKDGYFKCECGAIVLRGKELVPFIDEYERGAKLTTWKRRAGRERNMGICAGIQLHCGILASNA